jgi:hypothetical protein
VLAGQAGGRLEAVRALVVLRGGGHVDIN